MGGKRNYINAVLALYLAYTCLNVAVFCQSSGSGAETDESGSGEPVAKKRALSPTKQADMDKKCRQIEQFTPKMCQIDRMKTDCKIVCDRGQEGMDCGWKEPPEATKKLRKKLLKKMKEKKAKEEKKGNKGKKGKKNKSGDKRIVGGKESQQGEWPWQVYLVGRYTPGKITTCGGAILSKNFILTAAHCVKGFDQADMTDASRWKVWVGNHNKDIETEPFENSHTVKKIIYHDQFYANKFTGQQFNDVAIFQLDDEIDVIPENKGRICLPDPDVQIADNDQECYVTGWGKIKEGGEASAILKHAKVFTISKTTCNTQQMYSGLIKDGMMCAGYAGGQTDACQGDSGGSLACKLQGVWYSSGIVSWGWGCGRPNKVGVYSDVPEYKEWILNAILDKSDPL